MPSFNNELKVYFIISFVNLARLANHREIAKKNKNAISLRNGNDWKMHTDVQ